MPETPNSDIQYLYTIIQVYFKVFDKKRLYIVYDLQNVPRYVSSKFDFYSQSESETEKKLKKDLRFAAMNGNNSVTYLTFLSFKENDRLSSVRIRPIMSPLGNVIGCVEYYESFNPTYLLTYDKFSKSYTNQKHENENFIHLIRNSLTIREQEILFLLNCHYSQHQIGEVLQISRNTVKSAIENRILNKINDLFNLTLGNTYELLEYISDHRISIPFNSSLLKNRLIVLKGVLSDFDWDYNQKLERSKQNSENDLINDDFE